MKIYTEEEVAKMVESAMKSLIDQPFNCSIALFDYEFTWIFGHDITNIFEHAPWLVEAYRKEDESFESEDV